MRVTGTVRHFDNAEGWGVIDTALTPGGCWVGFAAINMPGYRTLGAGAAVTLDIEAVDQDGFGYRAVDVWPDGVEPGTRPAPTRENTGAYRSRLVIGFDDDAVSHGAASWPASSADDEQCPPD
ncbi:MAG: cold shock domain-containing protein [Jatrophihabitantaceae bacterium]